MGHNDREPMATTGGVKFKTGTVSAVDGAGNARVMFDDVGMESYWIPVGYPKTHFDKAYWTPDIGEHVRCIMDERLEDGVVHSAIYSDVDAVPWASGDMVGWRFKDGGGFTYNRATGELAVSTMDVTTITIGGDANISVAGATNMTAGGKIKMTASEVEIDSNLRVKGATMLEGGVGGTAGASTVIPGRIVAETDVIGGEISLVGHEHDDPQGGTTSPPPISG